MRLHAPLSVVRQYAVGTEVLVVGAKQASGKEDHKREAMLNKPLRRFNEDDEMRLELVMPTGMELECIACWLTLEQCSLEDDNGDLVFQPGMTYADFRDRYYDPRLAFTFVDDDGEEVITDLRDFLVATVAEVNPDWFPDTERARLELVRGRSEKLGLGGSKPRGSASGSAAVPA